MRYIMLYCCVCLLVSLSACQKKTPEFDEVVVNIAGIAYYNVLVNIDIEGNVAMEMKRGNYYDKDADVLIKKGRLSNSILRQVMAINPFDIEKSTELNIESRLNGLSFVYKNKVIATINDIDHNLPAEIWKLLQQLATDTAPTYVGLQQVIEEKRDICPVFGTLFIDRNHFSPYESLLVPETERYLLSKLLCSSAPTDTLVKQDYLARFIPNHFGYNIGDLRTIDSIKTDGRFWTFYHRDSGAATLDIGVNFFTHTLADRFGAWQEALKKPPKPFSLPNYPAGVPKPPGIPSGR